MEVLNPRAMSVERLYGFYDPITREWVDGILASTLRRFSDGKGLKMNGERANWKWMVLDGPVDPEWIESMNTVLDDNKVLTLNNGDRITLSPDILLLFETEHLKNASPATVSRVGVVYVDEKKLEWRSYTASWLQRSTLGQRGRDCVSNLMNQFVDHILEFKRKYVVQRECVRF